MFRGQRLETSARLAGVVPTPMDWEDVDSNVDDKVARAVKMSLVLHAAVDGRAHLSAVGEPVETRCASVGASEVDAVDRRGSTASLTGPPRL